jgi:predicted ribosomally synthesized peptide with SipW-like signal peptide
MKIIKGFAMIIGVAALASVATWAFLNDTATSNNQVLGVDAEGVDIELGGSGNENSPYFNITNVIPGQTIEKKLVVKNKQQTSLFRVYLAQTKNDSNIADKINVKVTMNPTESGYGLPSGYKPFNNKNQETDNHPVFNGKLSEIVGLSNAYKLSTFHGSNDDAIATPIYRGEAAVYKMEVTLDSSVGNAYKGKQWQGNLVVNAVQFDYQEDKDSDGKIERGEVVWQ